jgi:hypothetical protein
MNKDRCLENFPLEWMPQLTLTLTALHWHVFQEIEIQLDGSLL